MNCLSVTFAVVVTAIAIAFCASYVGVLLLSIPSLIEDVDWPLAIISWLFFGLLLAPFGMAITIPAALIGSVILAFYRTTAKKKPHVLLLSFLGCALGAASAIILGVTDFRTFHEGYTLSAFALSGTASGALSYRVSQQVWGVIV